MCRRGRVTLDDTVPDAEAPEENRCGQAYE